MDAKNRDESLQRMPEIDSGINLLENESLIGANEQQQLQLRLKDRKIEQLEERIEDLEDVITSYKKQIEDLKKTSQEKPETSWMKKLVAENTQSREEVKLLLTTNEDLTKEMMCLATDLEEKSRRQENMELRIEELQYQKNLMEMDFDKRQDTWKGLIEGVMKDLVAKQEECETTKKESGKMGKFVNKICVLLDIQERLEVDEGGLVVGNTAKDLDRSLKVVDMEVFKMVEERKMLRKNNKELIEMVEFLEFEGKVLLDDPEICKEKAKEIEVERNCFTNDNSLKVPVTVSDHKEKLSCCDERAKQKKELENKFTFLKGCLEVNQTENEIVKAGYERCEATSATDMKRRVMLERKSREFATKKDEIEAQTESVANVKHHSAPENARCDTSLKQNRRRPKLNFLRRIFGNRS
eukprot:Seg1647.5 transcript_id=Seg1647.5/GoldUCD/mRNA.D3Y31 product="hypothetical protein" protein_id=Seg1647.5/GoldUCD/D3Y31